MIQILEEAAREVRRWFGREAAAALPAKASREVCRRFLETTDDGRSGESLVDEATWQDLDLDAVFTELDLTLTLPGQLVLYRWLRRPAAATVLADRLRSMKALETAPQMVELIDRGLAPLTQGRGCEELVDLLWGEPLSEPKVWRYRLLGLVLPFSIAAFAWLGGFGALCLIGAILFNISVHYRFRVAHEADIVALRQLGPLLGAASRLRRANLPGLERVTGSLSSEAGLAKDFARRLARLPSSSPQDLLVEYLRIALLSEPRLVLCLLDRVSRRREELRGIFGCLGELDALRAVAGWRSRLPLRCDPEVSAELSGLELLDAVHPLVSQPVANSIRLDGRGVCITGGNMAGKSTFLRTLGVNVVLAQTLCTCTARHARTAPLRVLTSMRLTDDLAAGTSLFMAEAQRLLTLVRAVDSAEPSLCLCDEMLAGTHAADRSAASAAILGYLVRRGGHVVVATHDREMAREALTDWDTYHFAEGEPGDPGYDFRLRPGIAQSRNALRIIEDLGYPAEILDEARRRGAEAPGR